MFTMPFPVRGQFGTTAAAAGFPMPPLAAMRVIGAFGSAELVPLTPKLGQYFGTEKGLLVVRAPADSRLKLEDGDVIVDIDGRIPSSPVHAFRILGSYQGGEKLTLNVLRQKKKMSFDITIPEPAWTIRSTGRQLVYHVWALLIAVPAAALVVVPSAARRFAHHDRRNADRWSSISRNGPSVSFPCAGSSP